MTKVLGRKPKPLAELFWPKVDKRGSDACWYWVASRSWNGYGLFKAGGKRQGAHRVSYELEFGAIPDGLHVLHSCDNRACVNPAHLFLGTHEDNMADMKRKGRASRVGRPRKDDGDIGWAMHLSDGEYNGFGD